jgi:membrane fusion protein, multidrug efflux system
VNRKLTSQLGILALLLASLAISGCGSPNEADASSGDSGATTADAVSNDKDPADDSADDGEGDGKDKKKEEAVPVEVAELELGGIESVLRFSSNLEAEEQVKVFSQAKRLVTDLLVEEGDQVRKDQVLLRLQDDEQRSALAKAKSQLDKAQREFERQKRLFAQDLISEKVYNDANYELEQLQIAHEDAERELGYTEVRAPIGGTVTGRKVNLGDQVQIGQELFDIVDFDSIVALVYVPEKHLGELRPGLTARVSAQITGGNDYVGRVERISPIVDPRSGTVKVTIDVGGQPGLRPGMYVDVNLVTATREDAVLVPKRALIYDNDQIFVYRVTGENRAERVFIETALTDKFYVEPREGLVKGDRVVVAGQAGLKDGALVKLPGQDEPDQTLEASEDAADVVERASR